MIKKQLFSILGCVAMFATTATVNAQNGCYAVNIEAVYQGTRSNGLPITDPIRIDPTKALGQPQNNRSSGQANFFSLGKEGWIILKMGGAIQTDNGPLPDLRVYETTWGNPSCEAYPEYAEVSVSQDGVNFYSLGTFCQGPNISIDIDAFKPAGLPVSFVKIENANGTTDDYFDVDGVEALFGCFEEPSLTPGECFAACFQNGAGYVQGTTKTGGAIDPVRTNPNNALGSAQYNDTVNFVSLGYGGSLTVCFNGPVLNQPGNDIFVVETSYYGVTCENYHEYADVEVSIDGNTFYPLGTICLDGGVDLSSASIYLPYVNFVRIKNNDELTNTPDGFDVDAVLALNGNCNQALAAYLAVAQNEMRATGFSAYPNPSKGNLNFAFDMDINGDVTLEMFNINGQKVATIFDGPAADNALNKMSYDTSSLQDGMYIIKLTTDDGVLTGKVMIAKQ